MDFEEAMQRSGGAIERILIALAAIAGCLLTARFLLPRDIQRALHGPLCAALDAAHWVRANPYDPIAADRLRHRFRVFVRALEALMRRLSGPVAAPIRAVVRERGQAAGRQAPAPRAAHPASPDTS